MSAEPGVPPSKWRLSRLPPAGRALGIEDIRSSWRGVSDDETVRGVVGRLAERLDSRVQLYRSGRAALASVFEQLALDTGRREIVVPAYTCYSVPAAAVAARLRVRLVDVDDHGRIDRAQLATLPLEQAAAIVVSNLFGLAEPIDDVRQIARAKGCAVVDDAAQAFGARDEDGLVGMRGDAGILSFGRGKPLSALGGGAAVWPRGRAVDRSSDAAEHVGSAVDGTSRAAAVARLIAYDLALLGPAFRVLASIPALHIGETEFDPGFARGGIDGSAVALLGPALDRFVAETARRSRVARTLAGRVRAGTDWIPLVADDEARGVYPRLAVLAPQSTARDPALAALTRIGAGASHLYPDSLDRVAPLARHLASPAECPTARDLAARLITLPTHGRLRGDRLDESIEILRRVSG